MAEYNIVDPATGFYKVGTIINKKLPGYDPAKLNQRTTPHGYSQYGVSRDGTYEVVDPNYSGGGGFLGLNKIIDPVAEPIVDVGKVVMPLIVGGGLGAGALGLLGGGGAIAGAGTTGIGSAGLTAEQIALAGEMGTGLGVGEAGAGTLASGIAGSAAAGGAATTAKLAADLASGASSAWSIKDKLAAATLGLTAVTTAAAALDSGNKDTSATTTTEVKGPGDLKIPGTETPAKQKSFEDFVATVYGLDNIKSLKDRISENVAGQIGNEQTWVDTQKGLDTKRLTDTTAELSPYRQQLTDQLAASQGGTGLYKPINLSFGGNPITSFVPKGNIAQAKGQLDLGRENASIGTGLIDQGYKAGTDIAGRQLQFSSAHPVNEAADTYSNKLEELMKYFNPNGQTSTTTGSIPGTPWYTTALQGMNTGVNLWDKIYNPRQSGYTLTPEQIARLNGGTP